MLLIEMNDIMIDYVGYIDKILGPTAATNNSQVMRIVLNNGSQRKVQVVAWSKLIAKLQSISELKNIIHLEGAVAKPVSELSRFNDGNVNFQLEIKDYSMLKVIGLYDVSPPQNLIIEVDFDNINNFSGIIKLEGGLKNEFRILSTKYQYLGVSSIIDGYKKLEIHVTHFKVEENIFHKGHVISVIVQLGKRPNSPPYLAVQSLDSINIIKKDKKDLIFLVSGNKYI